MDHLLLAVDGSEPALTAARHGVELAAATGATVTALHVLERRVLDLLRTDRERTALRERGAAALETVAELADAAGVEASTTIRRGRPAAVIRELATADGARPDAVVLGREGRGGARGRLLGGVAEAVLQDGPAPVLVVPPASTLEVGTWPPSALLLPTDGSEHALAAATPAATLADRLEARLTVCGVVDPFAAGGVFDAGGLDADFLARLDERVTDDVAATAAAVRADAPAVAVTERVDRAGEDGVAASILAAATATDTDAVVMGTRGRSALGRGLLGSVAATTVRRATVPVLAVPPR